MEPLIDSFGRTVADVRISVIDTCTLRCTYCMPEQGLTWLRRAELLTPEEIERVARLLAWMGVRSVKLTGGEPTLRPELVEIVARLRALRPALELSMTTNGLRLDELARPLAEAGLDRITVSCDSLLRHRFAELTRRDALDRVAAGIRAAEAAGFGPVKLNCVVMGGANDDEAVDFARLARATGREVRFIEYMPLDADRAWERERVVPSERLRAGIDAVFPLRPDGNGGPARRYAFADGAPGAVGFISSVTEPFCASCDRIRLTADGQLRACLFALEETDLRAALRDGANDDAIEALVRETVANKWAGHRIDAADFQRPARSMSQIGG